MNPRLHARCGFQRYALRIQYHGGSFLGFSKQKPEVKDEGMLEFPRILSVEAYLERALTSLCGGNAARFENLQVSSRTDRGVHAWSNTMHVDLCPPRNEIEKEGIKWWDPIQVVRGLNHHLVRDAILNESEVQPSSSKPRRWELSSAASRLRILACQKAPMYMSQPFLQQGWNARYSATRRVYMYRIMHRFADDTSLPFEWDRSWRIPRELDVSIMQHAALSLVGTHDFTSFQAKGCQRTSPEMTLESVEIVTKAAAPLFLLGVESSNNFSDRPLLTTIRFVGNAFLYRQVRNLTGCLVSVGLGHIHPREVRRILDSRDRTTPQPFATAPPQGLYLYEVQHGDFQI